MLTRAQSRLALVTGATGFVGQAVCLRLVHAGYRVCVHYQTNVAAATRLVSEIQRRGGSAFAEQADLRAPSDVKRLFVTLQSESAGPSVLVHAAAINRPGLLRFAKDEDIRQLLDVNVMGAFRCVREAAASMMRRGEGRIVLIGSLSGLRPLPGQVGYAMSKAALLGLTRSAAVELGQYNVTVNLLSPGPLAGGMDTGGYGPGPAQSGGISPNEQVATNVAWLCSGDASAVTGKEFASDGLAGDPAQRLSTLLAQQAESSR